MFSVELLRMLFGFMEIMSWLFRKRFIEFSFRFSFWGIENDLFW